MEVSGQLHAPEKEPPELTQQMAGWTSQSRFGRGGIEKKSCFFSMPESNLGHPVRSPVTVLTQPCLYVKSLRLSWVARCWNLIEFRALNKIA
jgi:hypothetical protein